MLDLIGSVLAKSARFSLRSSTKIFSKVLGAPPVNDRGEPLDDQLHAILAPRQLIDLTELLKQGAKSSRLLSGLASPIFGANSASVSKTEERVIDTPGRTIRTRIYRPSETSTLPGCVFYHGGGFVLGSLESHDALCRFIADEADCHVVSVDYRLAPEYPFPAGIEDGVRAFRWVQENARLLNIDPERVAVAGDSAGGTLATVVAQEQIKHDRSPPHSQLLLYPKADRAGEYPSRHQSAENYFLTWPAVKWFSRQYLREVDADPETDPRISPIRFNRLDDMPPAVLITAGFDPLRDEGEAYADRLKENGVNVVNRTYGRLVHGFASMTGVIDRAAKATKEILKEFRERLHA